MCESKFKTKIRQQGDSDIYDLLLPDGRRVACGSLSHCWNERDRWEEALRVPIELSLFND